MGQFEGVLIARICHDLITPFNAIGLGVDALEASGDKNLLPGIKESVAKANEILKFIRELYAAKSGSFQHSVGSLQKLVGDFLAKYRISFSLKSDSEAISDVAGKIVMYNAAVAKEILPFGGAVRIKMDDKEIVTLCTGANVMVPDFTIGEELSYKNVMRVGLLNLLEKNGFKVAVREEESTVVIDEQMI